MNAEGGPSLCTHCLSPIARGKELACESDGRTFYFCCNGCRSVFRLLHEEGLEEFYARRRGFAPGPPEDAPFDPELFADACVSSPRGGREAVIAVAGLRCTACGWLIERRLARYQGVEEVRMNFAAARLWVRFNPERAAIGEIAARIRELGYTPLPDDAAAIEESLERERRDLLLRLGTAAFLSSQLMMYTAALYAGYFEGIDPSTRALFKWIAVLLTAPVLFYSGYPFLAGAAAGLRRCAPGMDLLVALGSLAAFAASAVALFTGGEIYADTTAMIVTLVLFGRYIEARARGGAAAASARMLQLLPRRARRLRHPAEGGPAVLETVPLAAVAADDLLEVGPGERIPVDGKVVEGISEVDESILSGESNPRPKKEGDSVLAGTANGEGRLLVRAERTGRATVLFAIAAAVHKAQTRRPCLQLTADRWAAAFVPAVAAVALFSLWYHLARGWPLQRAGLAAISVLVVACPCAVGLATPLAVFAGTLRVQRAGVFVRGGSVFEAAARIDTIFLDKTGTLTEGRPRITDVVPAHSTAPEILRLAASLEAPAEHPLKRAVQEAATQNGIRPSPVSCWEVFPGRGIGGLVDGKRCLMGQIDFVASNGAEIGHALQQAAIDLARDGKTVVVLACEGKAVGLLAAADAVRAEAAEAVRLLRAKGQEVVLVSGDLEEAARRAAEAAGIGRIVAEASPLQKAELVRRARREGKRVLAAGDGVNDAPALAEADVGLAMGGGAGIAAEGAGAILLRDDLRAIPAFLEISRKTIWAIRQNLAWAFSYNLVAIPLACAGRLHPIAAAAAMAASSLLVVGNSLRLERKARR